MSMAPQLSIRQWAARGLLYKLSTWSLVSFPVSRSICPTSHVLVNLPKPARRKLCYCPSLVPSAPLARSSLRQLIKRFGEVRMADFVWEYKSTTVTLAEYQWFLPAVIGSFHSRPAKFFTGFAMLIATLGNQIGGLFLTWPICCSD